MSHLIFIKIVLQKFPNFLYIQLGIFDIVKGFGSSTIRQAIQSLEYRGVVRFITCDYCNEEWNLVREKDLDSCI